MTRKKCKFCKRIIIENYEEWLEENKEQRYLQCSYCFELEEIK